jgi:hypothetical protein
MPLELTAEDRAALAALEESLWRTETRGDRGHMERTLAPDFFEFGRSGRTYTRAQALDAIVEPFEARLKNIVMRLVAPNVVLVTYMSEAVFGTIKETGNRSSLWTKGESGWQLRQGTVVPQPTAG